MGQIPVTLTTSRVPSQFSRLMAGTIGFPPVTLTHAAATSSHKIPFHQQPDNRPKERAYLGFRLLASPLHFGASIAGLTLSSARTEPTPYLCSTASFLKTPDLNRISSDSRHTFPNSRPSLHINPQTLIAARVSSSPLTLWADLAHAALGREDVYRS
ncbi:hypothetical protein AOLI_G00139380 [Acnodon oligacanthus]